MTFEAYSLSMFDKCIENVGKITISLSVHYMDMYVVTWWHVINNLYTDKLCESYSATIKADISLWRYMKMLMSISRAQILRVKCIFFVSGKTKIEYYSHCLPKLNHRLKFEEKMYLLIFVILREHMTVFSLEVNVIWIPHSFYSCR